MMNDIAVFLPVDRPAGPLIDCAAAVASLFESHLDGIACAYQAANPMIAFEASAVVMTAQYDASLEQAAAVLDQFEITTRRLNIPHDARSTFNVSYAAIRTATELSRLYDLNIVAQPDSSNPSQTDFLAEAILFGSGRPMLMIPYINRGTFSPDRVLIGWDGKASAARAVHNAAPFLRKAKAIDVVAINENEDDAGEASLSALIAHLARRDLPATPHRLTADTSNIHNAILSLAADNSTDLIVMGGYGHSRVREFILGGVTRGMFETITVPTLYSH
ncbi:MAG: universal stress protein [Bradyrhizobium sp.]|uniref:universal stress protein n=1 Tax=Bradyrhizobium sp. TaxID=376 RepID=UPI00271DD57F|nr:universal stress protein [Bradyrhizobium sp.]MDO9562177.1 universal stress protein [Bradyrhizobium sp.]MDP3692306.1 universal stress protein [Bradyrhizobium sp.]